MGKGDRVGDQAIAAIYARWRLLAAHADPAASVLDEWCEARPVDRLFVASVYLWFTGGRLNTCYNALDRHVERGRS